MSDDFEVIGMTLLSIQVCVPEEWDRKKVEAETNMRSPCGTSNGWAVYDYTEEERKELGSAAVNPNGCSEYIDKRHWVLAC